MEVIHAECAAKFANHEARIEDCEEYQLKNNGAVVRLDSKFNKVIYLLLAALGALVANLAVLLKG